MWHRSISMNSVSVTSLFTGLNAKGRTESIQWNNYTIAVLIVFFPHDRVLKQTGEKLLVKRWYLFYFSMYVNITAHCSDSQSLCLCSPHTTNLHRIGEIKKELNTYAQICFPKWEKFLWESVSCILIIWFLSTLLKYPIIFIAEMEFIFLQMSRHSCKSWKSHR